MFTAVSGFWGADATQECLPLDNKGVGTANTY